MSSWKKAARAAAIVFLAGCAGDAGSVVGPSGGPSETISDAAHAGAVPGFYFLPPMVKMPAFSGTFDAGLSPRVEICELAGPVCGTTLATYTRTSGVGGATIGVDSVAGQYAVNWHTNLFNLDPAKHYRISVFVDSLRLGFADVDVVSSGRELKNVDTQEYIPLQDDRTLPVKFRIERGIVGKVIVSPAADTVNVGGTAQFTATLNDLHGNPLPGPAVTWSSSNTAVATIDGNGLATGVSPGTVTITASVGYLSGTATLVVEQPNQPPVAGADTFEAIGNVTVPVAAPGVLANATDPDGDALSAVAGTFPTANGGTVTIAADGSFTYLSAAGFTGTDSFDFTVTDGIDTATGTATVESATRVWYVSNAGGAPGDGRDASPFVTLKAAEAASAAGETIFLLAGDGTTAGYDEGIVLKAGQALTGQGVAADVVVTLNAQPVVLLAANGTPTVTRSDAGATIQLAADNTVQGLNVASSAGAGIGGSGFGTFTANVGAVAANGGPALDLENGTVAATFASLSSVGSAGAGLRLVGLSGALSAPAGAIGGAAGAGVEISGGDAAIAYGGSVVGSGARAVDVSGRTGGSVTLSGNLADTGLGIRVQNNSGGTIAFTGGSKSLTTGANDAVTLANNGGATIQFAGGGVAVATTTGAGFTATGGGTLTVTGANNTIASAGGVALRVENTTIGVSGLTFRSVSANGGSNGIVLQNTGSLNGLQVTGTGAAGSGGTIQNTTGDAVSLIDATHVSLSFLRVQDNAGSGIFGDDLTHFALIGSEVTGNGDVTGGSEAGVRFLELLGTGRIENSTIADNVEDNIRLTPTSGTLDSLLVSGSTIDGTSAATGGNGLSLIGAGAASVKIVVINSVLRDNRLTGLLASSSGSAQHEVVIEGSTFRNNNVAVDLGTAGDADLSFDVRGNTVVGQRSNALQVLSGTDATNGAQVRGSIAGNQIGDGTVNSGSRDAVGIAVDIRGDADAVVSVTGNTIRNTDFEGIFAQSRLDNDADAQTGRLDLTLRDNVVGTPDNNSAFPLAIVRGTRVEARNTTTLCMDMAGNTSAAAGATEHFQVRQREVSGFLLERFGGAGNNAAAVASFVAAENAAGSTASATVATTFTGVADGTCRKP